MKSLNADYLISLPPETRERLLASLTDKEALAIVHDWEFWARDKQVPPEGHWETWLVIAGRGWGKTRTGAEWVIAKARTGPDIRIGLIGRTAADVRDVMVEGESGIMAVSAPWFMPRYESSKRRLTWPNGSIATTYSGDKPDQLRGPQHHYVWADELAAWRYDESWDQAQFGLRLGNTPQAIVTTTPRPTRRIRELLADPGTVISKGSTFENKANLPKRALDRLLRKYEGTRLGRQELHAEILEDVPGALWTRDIIEASRVREAPDLAHLVVAVDPAITAGADSDETGIIVCGALNGEGYVLEDLTVKGSPAEWAAAAINAFHDNKADCIVAESNQGGDMVAHTIHSVDSGVNVKLVHASRGKLTRAQPVSALYEQGRVHHVGMFAELEDQMCTWIPGDPSPDRMDAAVWGLTEIMNIGTLDPRDLYAFVEF